MADLPFTDFHFRVQEDAGNQPNAATAYDLSGSAETGMRTFASQLADTEEVLVLAEEVDADGNPAGAWEVAECTYNDLATDTLTRDTIQSSSTGSAIDWSVVGATPRLSIVGPLPGSWLVATAAASGSASVDFVGFELGYHYEILFSKLAPATDSVYLQIRTSTGGTFDSGATDYTTTGFVNYSVSGGSGQANNGATAIIPNLTNGFWGTGANEEGTGRIFIANPMDTDFTRVHYSIGWETALNNAAAMHGVGHREAAAAHDGIQFLFSSGNVSTGEFELRKIRAQ